MKTQLKIRTEFSFRTVYGPIAKVVSKLSSIGCATAAITDRGSTFGHVQFNKHCKAAGIKPIFGVELAFVENVNIRERKQNTFYLSLLARSNAGLREIYSAVEEASLNFYYVPRLSFNKLNDFSDDVVILSGNSGLGERELPTNVLIEQHPASGLKPNNFWSVPVSDNYMIEASNRQVYEILIGQASFNRPSPMYILNRWQLQSEMNIPDKSFLLADRIAEECDATLSMAENVRYKSDKTLIELCLIGARRRGIELNDIYMERLRHEVKTIEEKEFEDYFYVIADLVAYSKQQMLVGPARGSSCGSLVCYLLGITDIDPMPYGLFFERFIDVTRKDYPDIDIDFADDKRHIIFEYLDAKYGADHVGRLGTISRYKAKSAIGEAAKALNVPIWEVEPFKNMVIERDAGDIRVNDCIADTFEQVDAGKEFIRKFPSMQVCAEMEGHARHTGKHAAGIVITQQPILNYVAKDLRTNAIQIDKYDAESINLLKIDALGLRTLTIIDDCLQQINMERETLLALDREDDATFDVLRRNLYCGIFQFEGDTLQSTARKIKIDKFSDLVALTSLARPGPLQSGATEEWVKRRNGKRVEHFHPLTESITKDTYGLIIFQEQVMQIAREIGRMPWDSVNKLRKAMGKSLGQEYFDSFYEPFKDGALSQGLDETLTRRIWEQINTSGGYAFNKSHSVAYSLVSYWCMYLKGHHPLEYASATLRNSRDDDATIRYLKELARSGQTFIPFHQELSEKDWSIKTIDGSKVLLGGLVNIKGIGDKGADDILLRRRTNTLTEVQSKKLSTAETPYDKLTEGKTRFGALLADPLKYGIASKITPMVEIDDTAGTYCVVGKIVEKTIRSANEQQATARRNGLKVSPDKWLRLVVEDDTGQLIVHINRFDYVTVGEKLLALASHEWLVFKGEILSGNRRLFCNRFKILKV